MTSERKVSKKATKPRKPEQKSSGKRHTGGDKASAAGLTTLQQQVGNRAVQRLVAQREGIAQTGGQLGEEIAERIKRTQGGGQPLEEGMQRRMSVATGQDFSNVRVHTDAEADQISRQLDAKAFTAGQDVFFREGEYSPRSTGGQELIAHEMTHVVQQSQGKVDGGDGKGIKVNAPDDIHERQADRVAQKISGSPAQTEVQRQEEVGLKAVQRQDMPEEEFQMKAVQRQDMPEEEFQMKAVQRQDMPEEEFQMKAVQRQGDEELEELEPKAVQRQGDEELEELGPKAIQRQKDKAIQRKTCEFC
jgi:hypothetical protein